jgi:hypothetical protein
VNEQLHPNSVHESLLSPLRELVNRFRVGSKLLPRSDGPVQKVRPSLLEGASGIQKASCQEVRKVKTPSIHTYSRCDSLYSMGLQLKEGMGVNSLDGCKKPSPSKTSRGMCSPMEMAECWRNAHAAACDLDAHSGRECGVLTKSTSSKSSGG